MEVPLHPYVTPGETVTGRKPELKTLQEDTTSTGETGPPFLQQIALPSLCAQVLRWRFSRPKSAYLMRSGGHRASWQLLVSELTALRRGKAPSAPCSQRALPGLLLIYRDQLFWVKRWHMGTCRELP